MTSDATDATSMVGVPNVSDDVAMISESPKEPHRFESNYNFHNTVL